MESVIYLALNILRVYSIYRLIDVFLEMKKLKKYIVFLLYFCFYIINSSAYLLLNSPIINILSNIVPIFFLTFFYKSKFWKKVFVTILIYAIAMFCDSVIFVFFKALNIDSIIVNSGFASALALFFTALLIQMVSKRNLNFFIQLRLNTA